MKMSFVWVLLLAGAAGKVSAANMEEVAYIPWTFDDFDSNCNVIESSAVDVAAASRAQASELDTDETRGEPGR